LLDRARGTIALYGDKELLATADAHLVALDAHTGKVIWDSSVADYRQGYTFTSGPLAAHGKVVAGISGCTNRAPRDQLRSGSSALTARHVRTCPRKKSATFPLLHPAQVGPCKSRQDGLPTRRARRHQCANLQQPLGHR
jgi:hypothetical protein